MTKSKPHYSIPYPRLQLKRAILGFIGRSLIKLLTRTTFEGLENIPSEGPVILAGNHTAYIEPILITAFPRRSVEPIGAGDLEFEGIIGPIVSMYGFIPVNRGNLDRKGLNKALDVLKQDGVISIFPEGGTWAPGQMQPQIGVALLSQRTGAPVVPIGFSGLHGSYERVMKLKRPKLLMRVGKPIPALEHTNGTPDKEQLLAYSHKVLDTVFDLITEEEKDVIPVESRYSLSLEMDGEKSQDFSWGSAFAHVLHAPVLLESFRINLKLPVKALYEREGNVPVSDMQTALSAIINYLKINPAFFTYRLGREEGEQAARGVPELQVLLEKANAAGKLVRINTQEEITYRDGRLVTNKKQFVIEPSNQKH